jgi:hypothetical protein
LLPCSRCAALLSRDAKSDVIGQRRLRKLWFANCCAWRCLSDLIGNMLQSHSASGSKDLKRAPKPVVNKERAWKVWEEAESSRASGNANFFKTLRNNRTAIIVGLIAAALIFFRLQEATCVPMMCFFHNKKLPRFGRCLFGWCFANCFSLSEQIQRRSSPQEGLKSGG